MVTYGAQVCQEADLVAVMQKKLLTQVYLVKAVTYTSSIKTVMYHVHLWLEVEVNKLLSY